jgi:hypothetical protein
VMSMRLGCCDLVSVDSKTLDPFIFINFVYVFFCLCFLLLKIPKFGTRLK